MLQSTEISRYILNITVKLKLHFKINIRIVFKTFKTQHFDHIENKQFRLERKPLFYLKAKKKKKTHRAAVSTRTRRRRRRNDMRNGNGRAVQTSSDLFFRRLRRAGGWRVGGGERTFRF